MQEVRDAYKESLSQLTFNSRPVIMSLTELANEYSAKHAVLIVRLIEERMRSVSRSGLGKSLVFSYRVGSTQSFQHHFTGIIIAGFVF